MKNLNILGVHWKIQLLRGEGHKKLIKERLPKKGGLGQFADLRGAWQEKGVGVLRRGIDTLMHTMGISGQIFGLVCSFLSNSWLWVVLDGKFSQEYPVNVGVHQGSIVGSTLFLLYINDFLIMLSVILLSMLMMLLSTLSVIRHLICGSN